MTDVKPGDPVTSNELDENGRRSGRGRVVEQQNKNPICVPLFKNRGYEELLRNWIEEP
jgi:hypothetical protein